MTISSKKIILLCFVVVASLMTLAIWKISGNFGHQPIKEEISEADICGKWFISNSSLERLICSGYVKYVESTDHYLEFLPSGRCRIGTYHYTQFKPTAEQQDSDYIKSDDGTWKITTTNGFTGLLGHRIEPIPAIEIVVENRFKAGQFESISQATIHFYISYNRGQIILWQYIGDPDSSEYLDFIKKTGSHSIKALATDVSKNDPLKKTHPLL